MTEDATRFDVGAISRDWWHALNGNGGRLGRDRAAFAELRRSVDPIDLAFIPAFGELRRRLGAKSDPQLRSAAMIAHVLAHVREDDARPVARALGPTPGDEHAAMSEARFRRLLQAREDDDLARRLIRAVRMLKGKANIADLARAVWYWNDRTRREWAFRYLNAEPPAIGEDAA
jgi:CRISPR system Cascade subunit CasB